MRGSFHHDNLTPKIKNCFLKAGKEMINQNRMKTRLEALSEIGRFSDGGVRRLAHSIEDEKALGLVEQWMKEAGMDTSFDKYGNLIGIKKGTNPGLSPLVIGSHLDTQPNGGRFDGTIGVIGAIEVVQSFFEKGIECSRGVEVVSFADEEGCRFNEGLFGSRGLIGEIEPESFFKTDENGITRQQALSLLLHQKNIMEKQYTEGNIFAFLEMHIEQGPQLDNNNLPVGIVSGISGPLWLETEVTGLSGHAGTVPMSKRQDALVGASRIIHLFHEKLKSHPDHKIVGTIGSLAVAPNSINAIPEKVRFTVDLRDCDIERRNKYESYLYELARETAKAYGLSIKIDTKMDNVSAQCSDSIRQLLKKNFLELGLEPYELPSGAFHDALSMSKVAPFGMIFVRCKNGISHHPDEYASIEDIALGTNLLYRTALELCE